MRFLRRNDIILTAVLATLGFGALFVPRLLAPGAMAVISVDGAVYREVPLHAAETFTIESAYGVNIILFENGIVRMLEADCPDALCMHQDGISHAGESIICLPHHMVIRITGASSLDAVTR